MVDKNCLLVDLLPSGPCILLCIIYLSSIIADHDLPCSLLSHSAVVARELGLPTIVGVSGGLMKRLKTGMRVHLDARKGRVTILDQDTVASKTGAHEHEE